MKKFLAITNIFAMSYIIISKILDTDQWSGGDKFIFGMANFALGAWVIISIFIVSDENQRSRTHNYL